MIITDIDFKQDLADKISSLKNIEGFPIGEDKDILALSEPPYYTACPNSYITDFIREHGKPYDEETDYYQCEPFVGDVSEGKNEPIYNAHTYHTKVPHKAIIGFIEHFTKEGEIVLDSFSGTGMTGVAAQIAKRKAILSDLSPIASYISFNYNNPTDSWEFEREANSILNEVEEDCRWLYETNHNESEKGIINFTVWSDILICPYCNSEYTFFNEAVEKESGKVRDKFSCSNCQAEITKKVSSRAQLKYFDKSIGKEVIQTKQIPVLISYTFKRKQFQKPPDESDLEKIKLIDESTIPYWFPIYKMMHSEDTRWGEAWRAGIHFGISHTHHFFTKRSIWVLAAIFSRCKKPIHKIWFTSQLVNVSKLNRYRPGVSFPYNPLSGTMYIASQISEPNIFTAYRNKIKRIVAALSIIKSQNYVSTNSATNLLIPDNSIDYIFTDPPFGDNLMYSDLNFLWEAWLKVTTNTSSEAIINSVQRKGLPEYYSLMLSAFNEYYRVLKPKRWITVVFHNSRSAVWNAIQESMTKAGLIIAQVSVLDKQQGSFKQVTAPGAVAKDLIISAYKPTKAFEERFLKQAGENLEVDFVFQFLENLPKRPSVERTDKMLYSKMLAYYVQRGYEVRQDSKSFYRLLTNNFIPEDGFWFTPAQIGSYRESKQKMKLEGLEDFKQGSMMLFISDESSALLWLFSFLSEPKTFSETSTAFTQIAEIQGDKVPELKDMLNENFVLDNDKFRRPQGEAETVSLTEKRERALMREFESLLLEAKSSKKKIAVIRKEAVLYGFEVCYKQNRFEDMLTLTNRLDRSILENSTELTEFVEIARIKVEGIK
jgi:DNA modification methylase